MRRPGRKPTSETYSVAQVACLLLATSQLWMKSDAGKEPSIWARAESACPACYAKGELRRPGRDPVTGKYATIISTCPQCRGSGVSTVAESDALADAIRRGLGDPESLMVAMADLTMAWERLDPASRDGIRRFVQDGPEHWAHDDVGFRRSGQRSAVLKMWRAINARGEFAPEKQTEEAAA